tara:strand:- start:196 stop:765 length:570 start_codon:yes stop_codon:yes gene_type:complete
MLEEIQKPFKVTHVNLDKGDQFKDHFKKVSPFSKIPVLKNTITNQTYFESGAILIYLADLSGKFYGHNKDLTNQWLMAQMAYVGPMLGQHHQFHYYNHGKSKFGEDRFFEIAKFIYKILDDHLAQNEFLAQEYSIADIATFPWIARHTIHDIGLGNYNHLSRWYEVLRKRPAIIKGYDLFRNKSYPPEI